MKLTKETLNIDPKEVAEKLQRLIKDKTKEFKRGGVILGISGGIDSSVVAALCTRALGKEKVLGLFLPEKEGNPQALKDGKLIAQWLGIKTKLIDISPQLESLGVYNYILSRIPTTKLKEKAVHLMYRQLEKRYGENPFVHGLEGISDKTVAKGTAHFKIKHRMRMVVIYFYGEQENLLVVGSANKSESYTGLFCKFGIDNNSDIMPIGNLYRTQVLQLAKYLKVPEKIIAKPSSPDIIPGIDDKYIYITGLSSDKVDLILFGLEKEMKPEAIAKEIGIPVSKVADINKLRTRSYHMRNPSIILIV